MILSPRAPANAPMEKSPEAYRTIREVADSLDLPQHVLRFWETRFPQIRPLKRAGGRRYYRPEDIERLRLIKRLLYDEGYTIKGVQKLFKEQGVQALSIAIPPPDLSSSEPENAAEPRARPAKDPDEAETQPALADPERTALRAALAEIVEAQRILAQASASLS
jgi:DNA-binding transcriptional MerR regulator